MVEKVTMKLKVDLECEKCHRKVKKLLAKYPQIRDQKFDNKENIVTITVECCSPEKIRDKLCCKGRGCIESIEILEPKPPPPPPPHKKPNHELELKLKLELELEPKPEPKPPPFGTCCGPCSEGRPGGPCGNGCAGPLVCFCHGGYYGRPVCDCYGGGRPYYVCNQYYYFSEENTSGCTIM